MQNMCIRMFGELMSAKQLYTYGVCERRPAKHVYTYGFVSLGQRNHVICMVPLVQVSQAIVHIHMFGSLKC